MGQVYTVREKEPALILFGVLPQDIHVEIANDDHKGKPPDCQYAHKWAHGFCLMRCKQSEWRGAYSTPQPGISFGLSIMRRLAVGTLWRATHQTAFLNLPPTLPSLYGIGPKAGSLGEGVAEFTTRRFA